MLLKSRVGLAIAGVVVIGAISAVLAIRPLLPHNAALANPSRPQANVSPSASATPGTTPSASVTPTVPQATPTARPTRVPPTPTAIPVPGQMLTVRGDVISVPPNSSPNTFVVHVPNGGGTYICTVVTGTTTWSGVATSLATLKAGMGVDASGTYNGNGNVTVSHVDSDY